MLAPPMTLSARLREFGVDYLIASLEGGKWAES